MHQMCLAQSDPSIDKEWVVGPARILTDLYRRCTCDLIRLALYKGVECEIRIKIRFQSSSILIYR